MPKQRATGAGRDCLIEIGVEELPAQMVLSVMEQLARLVPAQLQQQRLAYQHARPFATPRRFGCVITRLAGRQTVAALDVTGPSKRAAFDARGKPTPACLGFMKRHGCTLSQVQVQQTARGEYVVLRKRLPAASTQVVLQTLVPALLDALQFAKTMRWHQEKRTANSAQRTVKNKTVQYAGNETGSPHSHAQNREPVPLLKFPRPIRWVVALYGSTVVPVRLGGLMAGRVSSAHRGALSQPVTIASASRYAAVMKQHGILVDPAQRRAAVQRAIEGCLTLAERERGVHVATAAMEAPASGGLSLLDEVSQLVECPVAFRGEVDRQLCALPPEMLMASMAKYQRVFAIADRRGTLLPSFIGVANGQPRALRTVRRVFEHILAARLADGILFYTQDLAQPLRESVARLTGIHVHHQLGTMYDKSQRLQHLARVVASAWTLTQAERAQAVTAAALCKADLVSRVVYEFPSLQGVMGGIYYAQQAPHQAGQHGDMVAAAIQDQYLAHREQPRNIVGRVVAIVDRVDTLVGFTGVGIVPSGSADPFGLRRAANELLSLLSAPTARRLSLLRLTQASVRTWGSTLTMPGTGVATAVQHYLQERFETRHEARYDLVRAVVAAGFDDVQDAVARIEALASCIDDDPTLFRQACTVAERTRNIVAGAQAERVTAPDPSHFTEPVEHQLWGALQQARGAIEDAIRQQQYTTALYAYARTFAQILEAFFERVMVNVEDQTVRANRLALLAAIDQLLSQQVADLTAVVIAGNRVQETGST